MSWFSDYRRRKRRAQEARDATVPLRELLARQAFGRGRDERAVEIPWVLDRVADAGRILDVGYAHAPPAYLAGLRARVGGTVYGADLSPTRKDGIAACGGDVRALPFCAGVFDVVVLISTLEHVGMDNALYAGETAADPAAQAAALAEVRRVLRPGGRALVTVPFGRYEDHSRFVNYDRDFWEWVVGAAGLRRDTQEYFGYVDRTWRPVAPEALAEVGYKTAGARGAAGLLCASLQAP